MDMAGVLRLSIRGIARAKLRSALAGLGIVIGVASVVSLMMLGAGARARVANEILALNGNLITVLTVGRTVEGSLFSPPVSDRLTVDDYRAIAADLKAPAFISPLLQLFNMTIRSRVATSTVTVLGVNADAPTILGRSATQGVFFGRRDLISRSSVCAISESLAKHLFADGEVIGKPVALGGVTFRVVAVLRDRRRAPGENMADIDKDVFVPFTSLRTRLGGDLSTGVLVRVSNPFWLDSAKSRILRILEERRGSRRSDFSATTVAETVELYTAQTRTISRLLAAIGGISLLVGGIGIMNVMTMAVHERRREIGILQAIGSRPSAVLEQFIIEAVLLSSIGVLIGAALGILGSFAANGWLKWPIEIDGRTVGMVAFLSITLGVLFGAYPASTAARLPPINALRAD